MALPRAPSGGPLTSRERPPPAGRGPSAGAPERWAEVRATAEAALARPPEARAAFLDRACGDEAGLRAEVEAQVHACERAAQSAAFLAEPAAAFAAPLFAGETAGERVGDSGPTAGADAEPRAGVEAAP